MFIWKDTLKRCNPNAKYTSPDGTRYTKVPAELYDTIPDPVAPEDYSDELYYRTETGDGMPPYVIYTKKSDEQIQQVMLSKYENALDAHLDKIAQDYRYNDRFTFALRAGYVGPYQAEGVRFATWMDTCNKAAYDLMTQVMTGAVAMPTMDEFIATLPLFDEPEVVVEEPVAPETPVTP